MAYAYYNRYDKSGMKWMKECTILHVRFSVERLATCVAEPSRIVWDAMDSMCISIFIVSYHIFSRVLKTITNTFTRLGDNS